MRKLVVALCLSLAAATLGVPLATGASASINSFTPPIDTGAIGWGYGARVNGMNEATVAPMPIARGDIPATATMTKVKGSGGATLCGIADAKAYCWGNYYGLGIVNPGSVTYAVPVAVDTTGVLNGKTIIDIVGGNTSCAVTASGPGQAVACWAATDNSFGQLGNGTIAPSATPVQVDQSGAMSGQEIIQVAGGGNTMCALAASGNVYCWGSNNAGSLGIGSLTPTESLRPVQVNLNNLVNGEKVTDIQGVNGGQYASFCALTDAANVYCWGANNSGNLGTGDTADKTQPTQMQSVGGVVSVSMAGDHTCVLMTAGAAACAGLNSYGQLGDRTIVDSSTPVGVSAMPAFAGATIVDISALQSATCVVLATNETYCWGSAYYGLLGDNGQSPNTYLDAVQVSDVPIGLNGAKLTRLFDIGSPNVCGATAQDIVFCWGQGSNGVVGNGAANYSAWASPVYNGTLPAGQSWIDTALGQEASCGVSSVGAVWCWGTNSYGELGRPTSTSYSDVAIQVGGALAGKTVTDIVMGNYHVCALDTAGAMYCWGQGDAGQLGDGAVAHSATPVSPDFSGTSATRIASITAAYNYTCAIDSDGRAYCWGENGDGQLGLGDTQNRDVPTQVTGGSLAGKVVSSISAGMNNDTCAIDSTGAAHCWGYNTSGAAGNPSVSGRQEEPVAVDTTNLPAGAKFTQIAAGYNYVCGTAAGQSFCWGSNSNGKLGNGSSGGSEDLPTAVDATGVLAGKTMVETVAGYDNSCALDSAGAIYCWGWNGQGQLGDGTWTRSLVPLSIKLEGTLVEGATGFTHLAAGNDNGAWQAMKGRSRNTTAPSVPRTPRAKANKAGTAAVLTWAVPESDGGSAITSYTVQFRSQAKSSWVAVPTCRSVGTALTCTATKLNKTLRYSFRVKATNDVGSSAYVTFPLARKSTIAITAERTTKGKAVVKGSTVGLFGKVLRVRVRAQSGKVTILRTEKINAKGTFSVKVKAPKGKVRISASFNRRVVSKTVILPRR